MKRLILVIALLYSITAIFPPMLHAEANVKRSKRVKLVLTVSGRFFCNEPPTQIADNMWEVVLSSEEQYSFYTFGLHEGIRVVISNKNANLFVPLDTGMIYEVFISNAAPINDVYILPQNAIKMKTYILYDVRHHKFMISRSV